MESRDFHVDVVYVGSSSFPEWYHTITDVSEHDHACIISVFSGRTSDPFTGSRTSQYSPALIPTKYNRKY